MPILQIRALPQRNPDKIQPALRETCRAIAEVYGCAPQHVWATWQEIRPGFYFEADRSEDTQPTETHPPIGELTCFEGKDQKTIEATLLIACKTLSVGLGIPNNIFMTYREAKSGQVVAGDGVVR